MPDHTSTAVPVTVTAMLDDAVMMQGANGPYLAGTVSYDLLKRWPNGERIHTSFIVATLDPNTFRSRSGSVFRVISWKASEND